MGLVNQASELLPEDHIHIIDDIIYDGARPPLNIAVPELYKERFTLRMLPPYSPFLNTIEQAHSCFRTIIKNELARQEIQAQLVDDNARKGAGLNKQQWRCNILLRLGQDCLGQVTTAKCTAWCGRCIATYRLLLQCSQLLIKDKIDNS